MQLSDAQRDRIRQRLAGERARIAHPWSGLARTQTDASPIRVVGYGSLVNPASAADTLAPASCAKSLPVIAFGVRRLFNYEFPLGATRYGRVREGSDRAALNARVTGSFDHALNGVLFPIDLADIPALATRERGYDLVEIPYVPWGAPEVAPASAWILSVSDRPPEGPRITGDGIVPFGPYLRVCREGAAGWGPDFLEYWLDTTFLADGATSVRNWKPTHG